MAESVMRFWKWGLSISLMMSIWWGATAVQAAPPTFQAAGAVVSGQNAVSPAWPAHAIDDIALLLVQTANQAVTLSTPAGFVQVASSPQGTGTAGGTSATRLTVFWARATSTTMATPTVADSGNNQVAQIITFRGVFGTGNPWDVTAGNVLTPASTAFSIPGATTTVANTLVVAMVANATDTTTAQTSGWTNANLSGLTEIADANRSSGNGGGFGAAAGVKATAGAYGNTTGSLATSSVQGRISIALRPKTTTLGDGANPGNATIAPSAAMTDLDAFTLQTSNGTDSVTALTVTLTGANAFEALSEVRITSSDGATTYFTAVANPASNTVSFSGGTSIPVTSTATTFKVRITPKTHANMPAPPGLSYAIGGTVTAFTVTNEKLGSDGASATVTVDNLSPAGATSVSGSAGNAQTTLNWTTSASADFSRSVILRWAGSSAGAEVPAEGTDYALGDVINTDATVVCVRTADAASTAVSGVDGAGTGGCSATALTNGQAYSYKVFQKDSNGNYDVGVAVGTFTPVAVVGSFNAFETGTTAGEITGVIKTKIAGSAFSLAVVAIGGGVQANGFTDTVKVELLGNTATGVSLDGNNCPSTFTLLQTVSPDPTISGGRSNVSFAAVGDTWKDVRVRIRYPTTSPTITSCSTDNFAIRPNALVNVSVSDQDWQTAYTTGTPRSLYNIAATGGNVHKAGRPFTLIATAENAAPTPAATANYTGSPGASLTACLLPAAPTACALGTLSPGTWSASSGTVTSTTAAYSEAGAFTMKLVDTSFASVDVSDSSDAERFIESAVFDVGRFVPDHFDLGTANTPKFKTFNDATCTPRSFTYIGQPFGFVTAPQATIAAKNASGATTANYRGGLWRLAAADLTQTYSYTLTPASTPGLDISQIGAPTVAAGSDGTGSTMANSSGLLAFTRSSTTPLAPFTAAIDLSMSVADSSENGVTGNGIIGTGTPASFSSIAFDSGNAFRYGRIRLANAYGSELLDLPIPMGPQYWNGTAFVNNAADACTRFAAADFSLGNYQLNLGAGETTVSISGGLPANLRLTKPGAGNNGSVDLILNLGAIGKAYLQGKWSGTTFTENPMARATFGIHKTPLIYFRENY